MVESHQDERGTSSVAVVDPDMYGAEVAQAPEDGRQSFVIRALGTVAGGVIGGAKEVFAAVFGSKSEEYRDYSEQAALVHQAQDNVLGQRGPRF